MLKGAITVFAPTDEAMARLDEETRAKVSLLSQQFFNQQAGYFQLSLIFTFIFQLKTLNHFYFSADWGILWTLHPSGTHSQACHLFWRSSGGCCDDDHNNDGDDNDGDDNDGDDDDDEFSK